MALRSSANNRWLFIAVGLVIFGGAAYVLWPLAGSAPMVADPTNATQVARGRVLYDQHCASCHGNRLQGQENWRVRLANGRLRAPPHDASGHTWHHPDQMLFELTKKGPAAIAGRGYQSDMPGFGAVLSDADIWAILAYIKSRWPAPVRQRQAEITRRAQQRTGG